MVELINRSWLCTCLFYNAKNIHISLLTSAPQKEKRSSVTTWIIFSCPFAMYIYDVSVIVLSRDWVSSYRGGKNKIFTHKGSRVRGHSSTLPRTAAAGAFYPIQSVRLVISMNRRGLAQPSSMYWATDKQHASEKKIGNDAKRRSSCHMATRQQWRSSSANLRHLSLWKNYKGERYLLIFIQHD